MDEPTEYKLSYTPSLIPLNPHATHDFVSEIEELSTSIYTERATKVAENIPLLTSSEKPYYEETQLNPVLGYSIDVRNIKKWTNSFLYGHTRPINTPDNIKIDIPQKKYSQEGNTLFVSTVFGELAFEIKQYDESQFELEFEGNPITLNYNRETQEFTLLFEQTEVLADEFESTNKENYPTDYDYYHSQLSGWDAEMHQPFAIYSPAVPYETVVDNIENQADESIIIVTSDGWRVCVRSPDDENYKIQVSLVELLDPVSEDVVSYYEEFNYPKKYINLPEIQYIDTLEDVLTPEEANKLKVLPYSIPFGDEELLFEKLSHANEFIRTDKNDALLDELSFEQFLKQTTKTL